MRWHISLGVDLGVRLIRHRRWRGPGTLARAEPSLPPNTKTLSLQDMEKTNQTYVLSVKDPPGASDFTHNSFQI